MADSNLNLALAMPAPELAPVTDARAGLAAQFIPTGARVLDLSEDENLKPLLPAGCRYQGRAQVRCDGGAVCNIAAGDFPTQAGADADVIVLLGALERIVDVENLFTHLRFCKHDVILSYHATDLGGDRAGFANDLSFCDLAKLFDRCGFRIQCTAPVDAGEVLMRLTPTERLAPVAACRVAVIADGDRGTFGGRLGGQMVDALLPGEAEVQHLTFNGLHEAHGRYDLVVLGLGTGMFQPLLSHEVLDFIGRAKASIGIFGIEHCGLMPRPAVDRLLDRLDTWFARYEDDVLLFGRGRGNVVHLGDWLIDRFPLNVATIDEPLQILEDIRPEHPLDRAISVIQVHKQVISTRLAPLLCALTAAEQVAYAEQPSGETTGMAAGAFRSMLIDIFGRSYPERQFFAVDREAVRRYKARVRRNIGQLRERIDAILRNVAVAAA